MSTLPGATMNHASIVCNVAAELVGQLKKKPCFTFMCDLRLQVAKAGLITYPDVMVICGESQYADQQKDTLLNPIVFVEVLSGSTNDYDRGQKFQCCRTLASLREYLTVAPDVPHIEHWTRLEQNLGRLAEYNDLSQSIRLTSIDCVLSLAEVYHKVDWTDV